MASDLERAVRWSKRFESLLERRFGARGRGLHEKIDSVAGDLDRETVRSLRLVATVRNKIVHEAGAGVTSPNYVYAIPARELPSLISNADGFGGALPAIAA